MPGCPAHSYRPLQLPSAADYGNVQKGLPPIPDMFAFFKQQLDARRAGGRVPLQINTYYEW